MTDFLSTQRLSAYLDQELSPEETAQVERALGESESGRDELARLKETNDAVHDAFGDLMKEPISIDLAASVQRALAAPQRGSSQSAPAEVHNYGRLSRYAAVAAATLLAVMVAFAAGYYTSSHHHEARLVELQDQLAADRLAFAEIVTDALEQRLSGQTVDWHNPISGNRGAVTPIRTFRNADGQWCREFREEATLGSTYRSQNAIACRTTEGRWQTRLIATDES